MAGVPPAQISRSRPLSVSRQAPLWLAIALLLAVSACSSIPPTSDVSARIAPLRLADKTVGLGDVAFLAPTPDLLALDDEMKEFVARYAGNLKLQRQRLIQLHRAIKGAGMLNVQYDIAAEGTASDAFYRGTVNCLSYANLLVAMAREAGLKASYQWVDMRPNWNRMGLRVALGLHVNVLVELRGGGVYMADIDPLEPRLVTGTHRLTDTDAQALYHSNIAMTALAEKRTVAAWAHAVRALQLSPDMSHLWVNLGAVYRVAGQHLEAERSYLYALQLDSRDRSAMNNLAVLYELQGRSGDQKYWQQQIIHYQRSNPYYHASKGDKAGEEGDWPLALKHYEYALSLASHDSKLLYALGVIHHQMEEYEAASRLLTQAIEHATLLTEIADYRVQLKAVKRDQLAAL